MVSNPEVLLLLADQKIRDTFELIASVRKIRLKDLLDRLHASKEDASVRLIRLKDANLIEEEKASVEDFNTYYVTADGLSVERKLKARKK